MKLTVTQKLERELLKMSTSGTVGRVNKALGFRLIGARPPLFLGGEVLTAEMLNKWTAYLEGR